MRRAQLRLRPVRVVQEVDVRPVDDAGALHRVGQIFRPHKLLRFFEALHFEQEDHFVRGFMTAAQIPALEARCLPDRPMGVEGSLPPRLIFHLVSNENARRISGFLPSSISVPNFSLR